LLIRAILVILKYNDYQEKGKSYERATPKRLSGIGHPDFITRDDSGDDPGDSYSNL
jgi:hypothetical protein